MSDLIRVRRKELQVLERRKTLEGQNAQEKNIEGSLDAEDRFTLKQAEGEILLSKNTDMQIIQQLKAKLLEPESSGCEEDEVPVTPRYYKAEEFKTESQRLSKERKDIDNSAKIEETDKGSQKRVSKPSLKQVDCSNMEVDRPMTFKTLTPEEYNKKVFKIKELDLNDMKKFIMAPPPKGKIVQVSILRDRNGLKNRFYPKYHVLFSVG